MKKLFTLSIIFALTSIVFISCKSSSLLKRRYNKGYYVHHAGKHGEPKVNEKTTAYKAPKETPVEVVKVTPPVVTPQPQENASRIIAGADTKNSKNEVKKEGSIKKPVKAIPLTLAMQKPFKTINDLTLKVKSAGAADDALSLLWVVIVILLILYLLSFLFDGFGLGGLVHLLALIIVILLILWLLRIL